jgi:hypothetical protein
MHGWWSDQEMVRDKLRNRIGSYGNLTQPLITLTDEIDCILLTSWPEGAQPPAMLTAMTNEHSDTDTTAEPDEHAIEQGAGDEPIPPITSDWTPEASEYRISTT